MMVNGTEIVLELVTSSPLGLTWANGAWLEGCSQVKRGGPTFVLAA
jgi:hypothetical protein